MREFFDRLCDNFGKIQLRHSLPRNLSATVWDADGGVGVPKRQIRSCLVHIKGREGDFPLHVRGTSLFVRGGRTEWAKSRRKI